MARNSNRIKWYKVKPPFLISSPLNSFFGISSEIVIFTLSFWSYDHIRPAGVVLQLAYLIKCILGYFLIRIKWFISFSTIVYFTYRFGEHLGCVQFFGVLFFPVPPLLQTVLLQILLMIIYTYNAGNWITTWMNIATCVCMPGGRGGVSTHSTLCLWYFILTHF